MTSLLIIVMKSEQISEGAQILYLNILLESGKGAVHNGNGYEKRDLLAS